MGNDQVQYRSSPTRSGFTLVELMVSIGIIAVLMGLLLPAISRANQQAIAVNCENNMRQCGEMMLVYSDRQDGWLFPPGMGYDAQHVTPFPDSGSAATVHNVWTVPVFNIWNPPVILCPADYGQDPVEQHSYVVNDHMAYWNVKYSSRLPDGRTPSDVILMGEKFTHPAGDYYMEYGDFNKIVDTKKHGLSYGSNYLMLDMHVEPRLLNSAASAQYALDPWDFANGVVPPSTAPNNGAGD